MSYPAPVGGTWSAPDLGGCVAVVTGATRGVGRGIAEVLGQCGATVYVVGRSTRSSPRHDDVEWTVEAAAEAVTSLGGMGIPMACDVGDDAAVAAVFDRVRGDHDRLDVLVVNAVGADQPWADLSRNQFGRIWKTDVAHWDQQMTIGVRSHFVTCRYGLPLMVGHRSLLVFTGEGVLDDAGHPDPVADLRAHATSRMAFTFGHQLRAEEVTAVDLVPGDVITHARRKGDGSPWPAEAESVFYGGRAVASLAADPASAAWSGRTIRVDDCAERYGFTDISGRRPDPHART